MDTVMFVWVDELKTDKNGRNALSQEQRKRTKDDRKQQSAHGSGFVARTISGVEASSNLIVCLDQFVCLEASADAAKQPDA